MKNINDLENDFLVDGNNGNQLHNYNILILLRWHLPFIPMQLDLKSAAVLEFIFVSTKSVNFFCGKFWILD